MSHPTHHTEHYPDTLDIEVLICTHNRVDLLQKTLNSLNSCKRDDNCRVGIFVVANACTRETIEFLKSQSEAREIDGRPRIPLRWLEDPIPGKSHALNHALPMTRGSIIGLVDDDHRVDAQYLNAICTAARDYPTTDLFCGRILPDWDGTEPGWVHDKGQYRIYPLPVPRFDLGQDTRPITPGKIIPGGGNLAIRHGVFERVGEFLLELGPQGHNLGGAEDIEWVQRAMVRGACLQYIPGMLQYHYVDNNRLTLGYLMRKAYERTASTTRLEQGGLPNPGIPRFMIRKVLTYAAKALLSLRQARRRFYLTRLAAALGEIKGYRLRAKAR